MEILNVVAYFVALMVLVGMGQLTYIRMPKELDEIKGKLNEIIVALNKLNK